MEAHRGMEAQRQRFGGRGAQSYGAATRKAMEAQEAWQAVEAVPRSPRPQRALRWRPSAKEGSAC